MQKRLNQRGFTLMELMVVIVIVAILAAVAVPLYINYVKDAQRTEAKGAIAAIITAEQVYYQKYGTYLAYGETELASPPADPAKRLDVDLSEARAANWTFKISSVSSTGFTVEARHSGNKLGVIYEHSRTAPSKWTEGDNNVQPTGGTSPGGGTTGGGSS